MAVELTHQIIIEGRTSTLKKLKAALARTVRRKTKRKSWIERVPFSFEAAYEIARMRESSYDPYNLAVFPIRKTGLASGELRYTFLTRNLEMKRLFTRLSRAYPSLTFRLGTIADDGDIEVYLIRGGRCRTRAVTDAMREVQYERVEKILGAPLNEVNDDQGLSWEADWAIFDEAMNIWNDVAPRKALPKKQSWYGRRVRLMEDEQEYAMEELAGELE